MAKSIEWVTYSQVFAFLGNSLLSPMKQTSDAGMDRHRAEEALAVFPMMVFAAMKPLEPLQKAIHWGGLKCCAGPFRSRIRKGTLTGFWE